MKPATVFLGEMTDPEVRAALERTQTIIIPTGSTEQHGPHGPLLTDAIVPTEVARRVAGAHRGARRPGDQLRPVVSARRVHRRRPHPRPDVHVAHRGPVRVVRLDRLHADRLPERPLRQHVCDRLRVCHGRRADARPASRAFPVNYWDGMTAEEAGEFFGPTTGLHANRGETSAVMAIDAGLVDLDAANAELPPFPEVTNQAPVHTAFFFSAPGSVHRATHSGTWGDAREASVEYGQRYLDVVTEATVRLLDDIERTFAAMPPR